jgi:hypothetical protein
MLLGEVPQALGVLPNSFIETVISLFDHFVPPDSTDTTTFADLP